MTRPLSNPIDKRMDEARKTKKQKVAGIFREETATERHKTKEKELVYSGIAMDLGYGQGSQAVGSAAARAILQTAQAQEAALEDEMARYDALLDDDEAMEALRGKRLAAMKEEHANQQKWLACGHGEYSELGGGGQNAKDVAREFFDATKQSERMVVHFYRSSTRLCDVFHKHLEKLARKHKETRFVKINVENCDKEGGGAAFLVERLGVVIMPTLVIVKKREAVHHIRGFDELGATENFSTSALEYVLGVHGALFQPEGQEVPAELLEVQGVNGVRLRQGASRRYHDEETEDNF